MCTSPCVVQDIKAMCIKGLNFNNTSRLFSGSSRIFLSGAGFYFYFLTEIAR